MKKILEMLGFNEKVYSWFDLDTSIQKEFFKKLLTGAVPVAIGVFFFIQTGDLKSLILMVFISLVCIVSAVYYLLLFMYKKFEVIIGECTNINLEKKKIRKYEIFGPAKMVVKSGAFLYEVQINHLGKYKTGMELAVYAVKKNIVQVNNDFLQILSPLAISIVNRSGSYEKEENN